MRRMRDAAIMTLCLRGRGVDCGWMNSDFISDFRAFVSAVWQSRPILVVLVCGGFILFVLVVIDTYKHRKKQKGRHKKRLH